MDGAGVVGPGTLAPVAKAAGFEQQQVEQGLLIGLAAGERGIGRHQRVVDPVKLGAELVHRLEHVGVALDPAQIVGPGGAGHREGGIAGLDPGDRRLHRLRAGRTAHLLPEPVLPHRLNRGEGLGLHPGSLQQLQVFAAVDRHRATAAAAGAGDAVVCLKEGGGELIHHHAAVFAIGDLGHDRRHGGAAQRLPAQPQGLVAGLHLTHQLGIRALGLDQGGDAQLLAAAVARHQLIGHECLVLAQAGAIGVLHAVLLHQQPAVAALPQGLHQLEERVGMVGQGHLRR